MMTSIPSCKRVLVTGGARGIGAATARRMGTDGRHVAVNYRKSRDAAEELCQYIRAAGGVAVPIQADVTDPEQAAHLIAEADRLLGGIDGVIHNAGEFCWRPLAKMSPQEWDAVLASNLSSAFYMFHVAYPYLQRSGAANFIAIGLSPADGVRAATNVGAYAIAKLGVQMFVRTVAAEVASVGIRVNCIAPGLVDNDHLPAAQREWMARRVPSGRLGRADEIAAAVSFLIGDEAGYINGATLSVSGGWDWSDRDATDDSLVHETFSSEVK